MELEEEIELHAKLMNNLQKIFMDKGLEPHNLFNFYRSSLAFMAFEHEVNVDNLCNLIKNEIKFLKNNSKE